MIKKSSRVSVIIPTYGRPDRLSDAINSVLNQTYDNIEIIIVDDNPPNTANRKLTEMLMREYSDQKNIKYIKHLKNKNGSAARNTGFSIATGEFIAYLDDDDIFLPNKIKKQVKYLLDNYETSGITCNWTKNNQAMIQDISGDLSKKILCGNFKPITSSLMIRSNVIKKLNGWDERYIRHQDYEFMLRFLNKYNLGTINESLVEIGTNKGENIPKKLQLEKNKAFFLDEMKKLRNDLFSNRKFYRKMYSIHRSEVLISYLKGVNLFSAFRIFIESIREVGVGFVIHFWIYSSSRIYKKVKNRV